MTRPLGKPPAHAKTKRSQLDLNQVSLIDVRAEDDSLLPGKGKTSPQGNSKYSLTMVSPFKSNGVKALSCIQEDQPQCEEMQGLNEDEAQDMLPPLATNEPAVKKKKKKTGFNLRKSLAWNNAFFTEEGVLDPEELSLVNRTFRKPPEEPKPPSNRKPAFPSKLLNPSAISKINFSPVRFQKPPVQAESSRHHGVALGSPLSRTGNASKRADLHNNGVKGFSGGKHVVGGPSSRVQADPIKHDKSMISVRTEFQGLKPSPVKKHIEENSRTSSGPPLPARGSPKPPLDQPKRTQSITSTLSSASKKMKDRLGMVFAGRNVGNLKGGAKLTAEDDAAVHSSSVPHASESAKLARCYSHSSYERFGRSTFTASAEPAMSNPAVPTSNDAIKSRALNLQGTFVTKGTSSSAPNGYSSSLEPKFSLHHGKEQASAAFFSHSQGKTSASRPPQQTALADVKSITKETSGSEFLLSRAKPSGLRMPSPKLGFFDKARTTNAAHVAVLRERTNGLGYDGVTMQSAARYTGATPPPTDLGGMSNTVNQSNGYSTTSQSSQNTCRPPTVSANANKYTKQTSVLKPPVPSVNSSYLHPEAAGQSNGTNVLSSISAAPHMQHMETSSKAVMALTQGSLSMTSGPCASKAAGGANVLPSIPAAPRLQTSSKAVMALTQGPCTSEAAGQNNEANVLSTISTAPHLQYTETSSKTVMEVTQGSLSMISGPCASEAAGRTNGTNVLSSIYTAPDLQFKETSSKAVTALTQGSSSMTSGPCATASVPSSILNPLMMHGSSSKADSDVSDTSTVLQVKKNVSHVSTSMTNGAPSISSSRAESDVGDTSTVLQVKKNVQNVLPAVKKMVTQLSLSPLQIVPGHENLILAHPQDKGGSQHSPTGREKACSNEEVGGACATGTQEEWPQVKSGAVQHSPVNKEPPKYGPWSPVRRNAPELGPFDCTKYTNTVILH